MKRLLSLAIAALFAAAGLQAQVYNPHNATEADILANIEAYIEDGMDLWNIPGTAISIVKDNQVVYAKGFGVKDINNKSDYVNEHTAFKIGSVSKAFTPVIVAQLVDEGKLNWSDKVKDLLPGFKLKDKFATDNFRVKDLFCHWSGLPRQAGTYFIFLWRWSTVHSVKPFHSWRSGHIWFCLRWKRMMIMNAGVLSVNACWPLIGRLQGSIMKTCFQRKVLRLWHICADAD